MRIQQHSLSLDEPFVLDLLADAAEEFSSVSLPVYDMARDLPKEDAMRYVCQLLRGERHVFSESEMFNIIVAIARKRGIGIGIFIRGEIPWDEDASMNDNGHIVVYFHARRLWTDVNLSPLFNYRLYAPLVYCLLTTHT